MADSDLPFDRGYIGDDILCTIFHSLVICANSADENGGPLSLNISIGRPKQEKCVFSFDMTRVPVVVVMWSTSKYPE